MIYKIEETTSTNDEARSRRYAGGDIVWAERQTAGRGQRGHAWSGCEGLDLTFSLVLTPENLPVSEQFSISRATALALVDTFAEYGIETRIKWTNDIYAGDRKITGILIENELSGGLVSRMAVGIGINVNRTVFDPSLPNPTSMALETGRRFDRRQVLERFGENMRRWYAVTENGGAASVAARYDSLLYRLNERHEYALADGTRFAASISGTEPSGRLKLLRDDGTESSFAFKEVEFLLKKGEV